MWKRPKLKLLSIEARENLEVSIAAGASIEESGAEEATVKIEATEAVEISTRVLAKTTKDLLLKRVRSLSLEAEAIIVEIAVTGKKEERDKKEVGAMREAIARAEEAAGPSKKAQLSQCRPRSERIWV